MIKLFKNNILFKLIRLLKTAFSQYSWKIAGMAVLSLSGGILEGVGITTIIPLFSLISKDSSGYSDMISRVIKSFFVYFGLAFSIKYLFVFIISLFIFKAILIFFAQYISVLISSDYERKVRSDLFEITMKSDWPFLSKQKLGYLDQILTNDVRQSSALLGKFSTTLLIGTNLIIYSAIVVNVSFTISALTLLFGLITFLVLKPLFYKTKVFSHETAKGYKELTHFINENFIGMKSIKARFAENWVFQKGARYFKNLQDLRIKGEILRSFINNFLQPVAIIFIVGIFYYFYKVSVFNFAAFAVIIYSINKVFENIQLFMNEAHLLSSQVPNILSVVNYRNEVLKHIEKDEGFGKFVFKEELEFKDITFTYDDVGKEVVSDLNFTVGEGEMVGLVGPSGSGKTTLVDILLRLLVPQKGKMLLDGKDVSEISLEEWRNNIGYVSQDVFLMNDTIANNIRFYDASISQKDIVEASKLAYIHDFIKGLPEGFNTVVGERGMRLSGGQKQRIVLARILARKPRIIILDEATSALDNESEIAIQRAIEKLRRSLTVIAIAHRLSTVENFDRIIFLEDGKIIETGSPDELLKNKNSYFFQLYNLRK